MELLQSFLGEVREHILYAEIMPYHPMGVEKTKRLGRPAQERFPDGRDDSEKWLAQLRASGADVRASGQAKR